MCVWVFQPFFHTVFCFYEFLGYMLVAEEEEEEVEKESQNV